jgi:tetratricopeptide (TPR) repeat protein
MSAPIACLDALQAQRFRAGQLTPEEMTQVQTHLRDCPTCLALVQAGDAPPRCGPGDAASSSFAATGWSTGPLFTLPPLREGNPDDPATAAPPGNRNDPEIPRYIGRYPIVGVIGKGGVGIVYRSLDEQLQRPLAIKALQLRHLGNDDLARRFLREARIMSQLQHPGVPPVHEIRMMPDGRPCFTMKLIVGDNFADQLGRRGQPGDDLAAHLGTFAQICQTLSYAHARRTIHRDLKPNNIMVGAFGEVQVMDWGLAKVLDDTTAEPASGPGNSPGAVPEGGTVAGTVMGTYAYMAPEQARGDVALVDERSDVFGLGAILCEILTGQPPYPTASTIDRQVQAIRGDLDDALQRLDRSGADADLVELCKRCLARRRDERPRHAGMVADAMAQYQAGVQERMRAADMARVAAQARAAEERKRRRVSVALLLLALAFVAAVGGAAVWYVMDQAARSEEARRREAEQAEEARRREAEQQSRQRETAIRNEYVNQQVSVALDEATKWQEQISNHLADPIQTATLLSNPEQEWKARLDGAERALQQAVKLAQSSKEGLLPAVQARLDRVAAAVQVARGQWELGKECDAIRVGAARSVDGKFDQLQIGPKYLAFFAGLKLDLAAGDVEQVAAAVARHPLRYVLVAALDHWAENTHGSSPLAPRLLEAARRADPDPWRDRVRTFKMLHDTAARQQLAAEVQPGQHSPHVLLLLSVSLPDADAVELLRRALVAHPRDFWLHFYLGDRLKKPAERISCYQAAVALRPDSAPAYNNLGATLRAAGQLEAAIAAYRKAVSCDRTHANAHNNLSAALFDMGDLEEAIAAARQAIQLDSRHAVAHVNLALSLYYKKDWAGAVAACDTALKIKPNFGMAHAVRGVALRGEGALQEAVDALTRAVELLPQNTSIENELRISKNWVNLTKRLPDVLAGAQPDTLADAIQFAEICRQPFHRQYACALQLYQQAFAADRLLEQKYRYQAACAAVQLAAGKDVHVRVRNPQAAHLRHLALQWLLDGLEVTKKDVQSKQLVVRRNAKIALANGRCDPDLAPVRDAAALAALPGDERQAWQQFWAEVDQLAAIVFARPQ